MSKDAGGTSLKARIRNHLPTFVSIVDAIHYKIKSGDLS